MTVPAIFISILSEEKTDNIGEIQNTIRAGKLFHKSKLIANFVHLKWIINH